MFWRRSLHEITGEPDGEPVSLYPEIRHGPIRIEPEVRRPAAILRLAGELERRGMKVVELFEEIESPNGQAALSLHLLDERGDLFAEIETEPWNQRSIERIIRAAAVLRSSEYADARLEVFSAYPAPEEVEFLSGRSPAALLQLELFQKNADDGPEAAAEMFRRVAGRHWGIDLDYGSECLPLAEELLLSALNEDERRAPVLDVLVEGLGCYLGEVIRRNSRQQGSWHRRDARSEECVLRFGESVVDAIGSARACLVRDGEATISRYARDMFEELGGPSSLQS